MRFCVLGSGSKGNCTYVASKGTAILIDAGFSGIEIERRLTQIGVDCSEIKAIIVTHEHGDHVKGVAVLSRRFHIPVYLNLGTEQAAGRYLEKLDSVQYFETGSSFSCGELQIHPFAISHDCSDPVGYTIKNGRAAFGYCTDTGILSKLIQYHLSACQGLVLECNHDLEMLKKGHYPVQVQQRVRSKSGHLANPQAIEFLTGLYNKDLRRVVLAHISESNNSWAIIKQCISKLPKGQPFEISLAAQNEVGGLFEIGEGEG